MIIALYLTLEHLKYCPNPSKVNTKTYHSRKIYFCCFLIISLINYRGNIDLFKVNNRNSRKCYEICSKLTIKRAERRHWLWTYFTSFPIVSIVDFEQPNLSWVLGNSLFPIIATVESVKRKFKLKIPHCKYECLNVLYHVTCAFQGESTLNSCLNVMEVLAQSRREIWSLSDCNWTRTHNHLVHKRTLNHLAKLVIKLAKSLSVRLWAKWLSIRVLLL